MIRFLGCTFVGVTLSLAALVAIGAVGDPPTKDGAPVLKKKPQKDGQPVPQLPDPKLDPKAKNDPAKDDEPVLKKKPRKDGDKADPKDAKDPKDPKGPDDLTPLTPAEKPEEILKRVRENMEAAEKRLKDQDPGATTRKIQRDIVRDLDDLINQQNNDDGGGSSGKSGSSSSGGGKSSRKKMRDRRQANNQGGKGGMKDNPKSGSQTKSGQDPKSAGGGKGGKKTDPGKENTPADAAKGLWGDLPAQKRMELDAYSRDRFMREYEQLLRQYYRTIAEQGRRKE